MDQTLKYYNQNASDFVRQTSNVDMSALHKEFLSFIPKDGHILDAGCGSARDSFAFHQKGYNVVAFDASEVIVELVSKQYNFTITQASFLSFKSASHFDGIWACASLLHCPMEEQVDSILHLASMLKNNGVFYLSYKFGDIEEEKNGRYFYHVNEQRFLAIAKKLKGLKVIKTWITTDQRKERDHEQWFNALLRKETDSCE